MVERFLRCEYCGGTYSVEREWCPHCLAPRPEREVTETRAVDTDATVFYSDNVMYRTIDDEPEKKSFAELEVEMNVLSDKIAGMLAEQRDILLPNSIEVESADVKRDIASVVDDGIMSPNEFRRLLTPCSDIADECTRQRDLERLEEDGYVASQERIEELMADIAEIKRKRLRVTIVAASSVLVLAIVYYILTILLPMLRQ